MAAALVASVVAASGCNGVKPSRTPEGTFEAARRATIEEDYEALWGLLTAKARESESEQIRARQAQVEANLPNYTEADRDAFRQQTGISAEDYLDLDPARAFAMGLLQDKRLRGSLRDVVEKAKIKAAKVEGDHAALEIEIAGDTEPSTFELVKRHGLWRIPDMAAFFGAFDIAGRARRAGGTPAETHRAATACIADEAYGDLWELFSTEGKKTLATILGGDQTEAGKLSEEDARIFQRNAGVTAKDFAGMAPKDAFALELKTGMGNLGTLRGVLGGRFVSADIAPDGVTGTVTVLTRRGGVQVPVELENESWYFASLK